MASRMGVYKNTYSRWERGEREPSASDLICLANDGWNLNWLLTGYGPERLDSLEPREKQGDSEPSQPVRQDVLKMAVQLAQEALDGNVLDPPDYGELVALIYDALANGLPSAQVLAFAKPAARGIGGSNAKDVDTTSTRAAGAG